MSVQNLIDRFVANVTVYVMSKQNKVRFFSAYANSNFWTIVLQMANDENVFVGRGIVWLSFLFKNEMNEIGVCENDKNRDYHFERTFGFYHLSSLFVSFLWFDPIDRISDL